MARRFSAAFAAYTEGRGAALSVQLARDVPVRFANRLQCADVAASARPAATEWRYETELEPIYPHLRNWAWPKWPS